jgi:ribosomal protein L37AE/L43A
MYVGMHMYAYMHICIPLTFVSGKKMDDKREENRKRLTVEISSTTHKEAIKQGFHGRFGIILEDTLRKKISNVEEGVEEKISVCFLCNSAQEIQVLKNGLLCKICFFEPTNSEVRNNLLGLKEKTKQ